MKDIILVGIIVSFLMVSSVYAQTIVVGESNVISSSDLSVILTNQNPNPVEPDAIVDIEIEIQNNGFGDAADQVIEFIEKAPFSLIVGEDKIKRFDTIPGRSSVKATYKIKISSDAQTNTYDLELKMYSENRPEVYTKKKASIIVQGSPKLVIQD
ncbi:MAG: hypothetical protein ABIH52_00540, partial [Candidatus Aenigmatarchaeota archaeon]